MKEEAKKIIRKMLNKMLILIWPAIIVVIILVVGGMYILTIKDGDWKSNNLTPQNYKGNTTFTENGLEVNMNAVLDEALKNAGYSNSDIENMIEELKNQGYSGKALEDKEVEKKLELLGIDVTTSEAMEIIWKLNKDLYEKYGVDNYQKLEYLINAELVTKLPYIDSLQATNKVNGRIFFDRYRDGNTSPNRLVYTDEASFDHLVETQNPTVLNAFTVTENNEIKIAYYEEERVSLTTNDSTVNLNDYDSRVTNDNPTSVNIEYKTKNIAYTSMIPERYSLPFEYLWALLVVSEDYDFVKSLADLAYDSTIVISIYDNVIENTIDTTYTYDRHEIIYSQIRQSFERETIELDKNELIQKAREGYELADDIKPVVGDPSDVKYPKSPISGDEEKDKIWYNVEKITSTYTNSIEVKVTYANVWIAEYRTKYNYYTNGTKYGSGEEPDFTQNTSIGEGMEEEKIGSRTTDMELQEQPSGSGETEVEVNFISTITKTPSTHKIKATTSKTIVYTGDIWTAIYNSEQNVQEDTYLYTSTYVNDPSSTTTREKTNMYGEFDKNGKQIGENFCSLFKNSAKKQYILDNKLWLIDILEENPETADLIDLNKYLINKATGKEYYELYGFNFEGIFNTTQIGILYGGSVEEQLWFALLDAGYTRIAAAGVLGNIFAESGARADNLQNSYETELGMTDEEYTEAVNNGTYTNFINDSAGYGLAQWTSEGRKEGLYLFAKEKGTTINDVSMQIEYLLGEISQSGGANGYATFQMGTDRRGYSYSSWKDATTVEEAAMAFCYVFERPKGTDHNDRATYADMYYERYKDATELSSTIGNIGLTGDSQVKMHEMLQEAVRIANDNRYGYSQEKRNQEFYYDCSSLVARLYKQYFGIEMPNTTANYPAYENCYMGSPTTVQLQPGDVLWRRSGDQGHVTLYIGNGNFVAAHTDQKPRADQITVYQDTPSDYMRVYRFIK